MHDGAFGIDFSSVTEIAGMEGFVPLFEAMGIISTMGVVGASLMLIGGGFPSVFGTTGVEAVDSSKGGLDIVGINDLDCSCDAKHRDVSSSRVCSGVQSLSKLTIGLLG